MSTDSAPSHILIHRYTPGTGPQEGTPEMDTEMTAWAQLDAELREAGQLISGWALNDPVRTQGAPAGDRPAEIIFAIHALAVEDDAEADQIASRMPHLNYGSTEIRRRMP